MKSLLIIDKPNTCVDCRLNDDNNGYPMCVYLHSSHGSLAFHFNGDKERNPYCPLRPLPTDMIGAYANSFAENYISFAEGWDSYEKALMGETE